MCLSIMNLSTQVLLLVLFTQHIFKTCLGNNLFFNELFVTKISFSLSKYLLSYFFIFNKLTFLRCASSKFIFSVLIKYLDGKHLFTESWIRDTRRALPWTPSVSLPSIGM